MIITRHHGDWEVPGGVEMNPTSFPERNAQYEMRVWAVPPASRSQENSNQADAVIRWSRPFAHGRANHGLLHARSSLGCRWSAGFPSPAVAFDPYNAVKT